mgnify:CR=1 FL=1
MTGKQVALLDGTTKHVLEDTSMMDDSSASGGDDQLNVADMTTDDIIRSMIPQILHTNKRMEREIHAVANRLTSLEATVASNEDNICAIDRRVASIDQRVQQLETTVARLAARNLDLERHSRSFNIRLLGVREEAKENTLFKTMLAFKEAGLNPDHVPISIAHRVGKLTTDKTQGAEAEPKPRAIIIRFVRKSDVRVVLNHKEDFKKRGYSVFQDLPADDVAEKKRLQPLMTHYATKYRVGFRAGKMTIHGMAIDIPPGPVHVPAPGVYPHVRLLAESLAEDCG